MDDRDCAEKGDLVKDLPPLPEPAINNAHPMMNVFAFGYHKDQMRDYALAAIAPYKAEVAKLRDELETFRLGKHHQENANLRELLREAREALIHSHVSRSYAKVDLVERIDAALGGKK